MLELIMLWGGLFLIYLYRLLAVILTPTWILFFLFIVGVAMGIYKYSKTKKYQWLGGIALMLVYIGFVFYYPALIYAINKDRVGDIMTIEEVDDAISFEYPNDYTIERKGDGLIEIRSSDEFVQGRITVMTYEGYRDFLNLPIYSSASYIFPYISCRRTDEMISQRGQSRMPGFSLTYPGPCMLSYNNGALISHQYFIPDPHVEDVGKGGDGYDGQERIIFIKDDTVVEVTINDDRTLGNLIYDTLTIQ